MKHWKTKSYWTRPKSLQRRPFESMSKVEQKRNEAAIQGLWEEIGRIKEQQAAAEKMAALVGMTADESMQYKDRHGRIKELTKELVALDGSITGGRLLMTKKEAKEITRHGRDQHCGGGESCETPERTNAARFMKSPSS